MSIFLHVQKLSNKNNGGMEILSIPVVHLKGEDMIIWGHAKEGNYSVKSGYHVAMDDMEDTDEISTPRDWDRIWNLQVPPKVMKLV